MPFDNLPQELRETPNWIVWRLSRREGQDKPTKVPYSIKGGMAKTTDPATWSSYAEAVAAYASGRFAGIGFVFTNTPFVGVDLDGGTGHDAVLDAMGGLTPTAQEIVTALTPAYVERSQSKHGLHIIVRGKLPAGGRRKGLIEMYDASSPRYFAMTGDILPQSQSILVDQTAALAALHERWYIGAAPVATPEGQKASLSSNVTSADIEALVAKIQSGPDARTFSPLYIAGETRPNKSPSESDMTMACVLAKYTRDPALIAAVMNSSALKREKWRLARPGGTILSRVIAAALLQVPARAASLSPTGDEAITLAELLKDGMPKAPPEIVRGLAWAGRITLVAAREGIGKSTLFAEAAAAFTVGRSFLPRKEESKDSTSVGGSVLWVLVEEHQQDLIRRAVRSAGGDPDAEKPPLPPGAALLHVLSHPTDRLEALKTQVTKIKPRLIVIDTLHAFAGPLVEHSSQSDDWQTVMDALREIANSEWQPAILMAAQATKGTGDYRDSTAIGHGVDVVLTLEKPGKDDSDNVTRELLVRKARFPVGKTTYQLQGYATGSGGEFLGGMLVRIGNVDHKAEKKIAEERKDDARGLRLFLALEQAKKPANSDSWRGSNKHIQPGIGATTYSELVKRFHSKGWLEEYALTEAGRVAAVALPSPTKSEKAAEEGAAMDAALDNEVPTEIS